MWCFPTPVIASPWRCTNLLLLTSFTENKLDKIRKQQYSVVIYNTTSAQEASILMESDSVFRF